MVQIIPTVLATSKEQYQQDIEKFAAAEALKGSWIHLDFMDNKFVPNQGVDPRVTLEYPTSFAKEAHLMVNHPKEWVEKLAQAGFKRVFFHLEAEDDIDECIDNIKKQGLEVGLVLKHETSIEKLAPFVTRIDSVILMTVVPGFQGQPFIPESLDKIKSLKMKNWPIRIGVDGAVKAENIRSLVEAGVDFVIVGSYLLKGDVDENFENLWEAIH